ncbi:MAG: IMP dehydrogenase [Acidobacteria bacterium]|nr:IMP dehydrogenase [Acidobacteriota bacterium]
MAEINPSEAITFDDVLLLPRKSDVLPSETDTATLFSRHIRLNIPVTSAAMDTVTEAHLAIAIAQQGGIGAVHRNLSIEAQRDEVDKVKRSESGMIVDPVTMTPDRPIAEALDLMSRYHISGVPIVDTAGHLVGILTNRDLRFETRLHLSVGEVMTKAPLVTTPVGTTLDQAKALLQKHRIEKLLVVDGQNRLKGLITVKDIQKAIRFPNAAKDDLGRLRVGAAVGATGDYCERAAELVRARVDVLVVDTAHGHTGRVLQAVRELKRRFPDLDVVAGNVATEEGARELIRAGADAVKVGMGPGSICTTRVVTGAGVPQITAIMQCRRATRDAHVPLIADGGIKFSGDVTKAMAAGADCVMVGSLFAGTEESPGETILYQGRTFKAYRGMGSIGAMRKGSSDRYGQDSGTPESKLVPEGIEGRVPYKGSVAAVVEQLVGGLRAGMGYCGSKSIHDLHENAEFIKITQASLQESHVHDVIITKEAPNYQLD